MGIGTSLGRHEQFEDAWPGSSALATECVLSLFALVDRMDRAVAAWGRDYDIPSAAAVNVLEILRGAGEALPPSVIAERMVVTRATLTGVLHSLEKRGLVSREPHPGDGRMRLVRITPRGAERVRAFLAQLHRVDRALMSALTEREQRALRRMLGRLMESTPTAAVPLERAAAST